MARIVAKDYSCNTTRKCSKAKIKAAKMEKYLKKAHKRY